MPSDENALQEHTLNVELPPVLHRKVSNAEEHSYFFGENIGHYKCPQCSSYWE